MDAEVKSASMIKIEIYNFTNRKYCLPPWLFLNTIFNKRIRR